MRRRARWCVLVVLAALGASAPATTQAADDLERVEPVQVAGPADPAAPGPRFSVRTRGRRLCAELRTTPRSIDAGSSSVRCDEVPVGDVFAPFRVELGTEDADEEVAVGGAVRGNVATVELELPGGRVERVPTEPAPAALRGRPAGELRYYVAATGTAEPFTRRLLDAEGRVLDEEDDPYGEGDRPPVLGPVRLGGGLRAAIDEELEPILGDLTRRRRGVLLSLGGTSGGAFLPVEGATALVSGGCRRSDPSAVFGVTTPGTAIEVVQTDGRRLRARTYALPASFEAGAALAWSVPLPHAVGVRSLVVRRGEQVDRARLALPPAPLACGGIASVTALDAGTALAGPEAVFTPPGDAPALHVRDEDERLCVAVGRPTDSGDCEAPGPYLGSTVLAESADGRLVGGAVSARIRSVRVRFEGGRSTTVGVTPGDAYTGRYAGQLGFFAVAAPRAGQRAIGVELLDPQGRTLHAMPTGAAYDGTAPTPARKLRIPTPGRLVVGVTPRQRGSEERCLLVARGRLPRGPVPCTLTTFSAVVAGVADCRLGGLVLAAAPTRGRRIDVRLSDGSLRRMRGREGVVALVVPRRLAVRGIVVRDRRGRTIEREPLPVPPLAEQCGYEFTTPVSALYRTQ